MFNLDFLPIVNLLGFIVLVITTVYQNRKSGKDTVTRDVLDLYQKQIAVLKDEIEQSRTRSHDLANQIQALTFKIGKLEGTIKEKDQKLTDYMTIFQNRNPELVEFMEKIEVLMADIHTFMKQLNTKVQTNQARNENIDEATDKETGKIMRGVKTKK